MKSEKQLVKEKIDGFLTKFTDKQVYGWKKEFDESQPKEKKETYMQDARMPLWCPKCERVMSKKLDNKMYWLHNMCFDCVIEFETKLRIEGRWEEYERNKVKENIRSYIKECVVQVAEEKARIGDGLTYVNVVNEKEGVVDYEKWKQSDGDIKKFKEQMDEIIKQMHDDFKNTFGESV